MANSLALARSFLPRDAKGYPTVPQKYHGTCARVEVLPFPPTVFGPYVKTIDKRLAIQPPVAEFTVQFMEPLRHCRSVVI